jgi:RNA polymerase sigma-70 factor, ECF subfamily
MVKRHLSRELRIQVPLHHSLLLGRAQARGPVLQPLRRPHVFVQCAAVTASALTALFAAGLAPDAPAQDPSTLGAWLARAIEDGRAAWPEVTLAAEDFVAHLARHYSPELNVVELYLACACGRGDARAIAAFDRSYLTDVARAVRQVDSADPDDVLQRVREQLFVRADPEPLIARYAGRGSLRGWVRSIAVRTALKQLQRNARTIPVDDQVFLEFAAGADEPALEPFKQRYRDELRAAFHAAVAELTVRQRNLLRQYYLDGLTIDDLGAFYRVHRATAARWLTELREALLAGVVRALESALALDGDELRSMIRLVSSQLELSLERVLAPAVTSSNT